MIRLDRICFVRQFCNIFLYGFRVEVSLVEEGWLSDFIYFLLVGLELCINYDAGDVVFDFFACKGAGLLWELRSDYVYFVSVMF